MSALLMTYRELLTDLEQRLGLNSDATLGVITSSPFTEASLARFLSNASKTCWETPEGKDWVWPFTVQTATLTPGVNGVIDPAGVDYGVWLSLFNIDPRPVGSAGPTNAYYGISWTQDSAGIWPNLCPATLFAFFIPRAPEFSMNPVVRATEYDLDDVVYDGVDDVAVDATPSTGQCYRCLADGNSGAELYDPTKWAVQTVYKNFQSAMAQYAHATWLRSKGNYDVATEMDGLADADLQRKWAGLYTTSPTGHRPAHVSNGQWR